MSTTPSYCTCKDDRVAYTIECLLGKNDTKCPACSRLADVESRIRMTRDLLATLFLERRDCYAQINLQHDSLTNKLPVEVISIIFTMARKQLPNGNWDSTTPVTLGLVSRTWRNITLSIPMLWNSVTLNIPYRSRSLYIWGHQGISDLMSRSESLPLTLAIKYSGNRSTVAPLFDALRVHSSRWETLDLNISELFAHQLLADCSAPQLKNIRLDWMALGERVNSCGKNIFPSPYILQTSGSAGGRYGSRMDKLPVSWHNVQDFYGDLYDFHEYLKIIRSSPLLRKLHIPLTSLGSSSISYPSQGRVENSSLTSLQMTGLAHGSIPQVDVSPFFDRLVLPSLAELKLESFKLHLSSLATFIKHSSCSLLTLVLGDWTPFDDDEDALSLFLLVPTLNHLEICDRANIFIPSFIDTFVQSTNQGSVHSGYLPCLGVLKLTTYRDRDDWLPDSRLFTYMDVRPLRQLDIEWIVWSNGRNVPDGPRARYEDDVLQFILDLRKRGVEINITGTNSEGIPGQDFVEFCLQQSEIESIRDDIP